MAPGPHQRTQHVPGQPAGGEPLAGGADSPPAGYGRLARKTARRTTDLLAIALVAAAGLGLGRHVIGWWNADPAPPVVPAAGTDATAFGQSDGTPLRLEFGDAPYAIERTTFAGDRGQASAMLADACAALAASAERPAATVLPAEERLLATAAGLAPVLEQPGRWRVYVLDGPVILAAGVGVAAKGTAPVSAPIADATPVERVLCWGLAFPAGENLWTLYTFRPAGDGRPPLAAEIADCLPPGSRRVLSVQSATGEALIVFEGTAQLSDWIRAIETRLKSIRLTTANGWQRPAGGASARFQTPAQDETIIEVQIIERPAGLLTGVISGTARNN